MKYKLLKETVDKYTAIEQILYNRDIEENEMYHYLYTTDEDINEPELLGKEKMMVASNILFRTIKENKKAIIIVDSDCDGFTSSAILINYLYDLYPQWIENNLDIFFHQGKQHGLEDCEELILHNNYSLVLVPDAGSNDIDCHKLLFDEGIKCIILDHHESKIPADYQYAIIINNNNEKDEYPNKAFSGAGITWQFCRFLDKVLNINNANNYIDLVALGNLGDVMSLKSIETKHIINKGIKEENIKNPFLKGMVKKNAYSIGNKITGWGIVFYVVPFINAVQRSGTQEEKELLFNAMLNHKASIEVPSIKRGHKPGDMETILEQALRVCTNVKARQTKAQTKGMEYLEQIIKEKDLMNKHKVLLLLIESGKIDAGIAGLCANKIMSKYQRPCCVLTKTDSEYQGSARGYEQSGIHNFKEICEQTNETSLTAGHQSAFGLGIPENNIVAFLEKTDIALKDMQSEPIYYVDYIYKNNDIKRENILDIANLDSLWGKDIPESLIAIEDLKITKDMIEVFEKTNLTLKIKIQNGIDIMLFNASKELCDKMKNNEGYIIINLVGKCNINEWSGKQTPQIFIEDMEIVDENKYLF